MSLNYISTSLDAGASIQGTFTSNRVSVNNTVASSFELNVTAISGTNAAVDVTIQFTMDNGETWDNYYQFPRITAATTLPIVLRSPFINNPGQFIRYIVALSGTTPSVTYKLWRSSSLVPRLEGFRQLYDRSTNIIATNATTQTVYTAGAREVDVAVTLNYTSLTTTPQFVVEMSSDNINWTTVATITGFTSTIRQSSVLTSRESSFMRVRCSVLGSVVGGTWLNTCFRIIS